jgi:ABC-type glycerol-3-phosphate transport system permease component
VTGTRTTMAALFLLPALVLLGALVVYPIGYSVVRSFYDQSGEGFAGFDNYQALFTDDGIRTALKNNIIWVVFAPTVATALGLIFAVLTERVRWGTAFKLVVFMPMAISMLAAGIIFRLVYDQDPDKGVANAVWVGVHDTFAQSSAFPKAHPGRESPLEAAGGGAFVTKEPVRPGEPVTLPLVGVAPDLMPDDARPAQQPPSDPGKITGTTWQDFTRGKGVGTLGAPDPAELGYAGMKIEAVKDGEVVASTTAADDGTFTLPASAEGALLRLLAGHTGHHRVVHLDVGGLRDGADRGRSGRGAAGAAGGGAGGRRERVAGVPQGHRAAAGAGPRGRHRHLDDQRPEGVRPGVHHRAGLLAGRRERARPGAVPQGLRRGPAGRGQRDRGVPAAAGDPGDVVQRPAAQAGGAAMKERSLGARVVERLSGGAVRAFLIVVGLFWLVPTIGLLLSSLRSTEDMNESGWWTVFTEPAQLTVDSYEKLLENGDITDSLVNTVLITVPATVLVVVIGALAGYAFAWMEFPGRDWWFLAVVGLLVVPVQVALIPIAELFGNLGLFGSILGVILFHVGFGLPFAVFLLRNFFAEIPRELLEAARLDGAGELRLFARVVMPLGGPAIASLGIFQFLWVWNDMLVALVFTDAGSQPITVALQTQVRQFGNNIDVLAPGAFISMVVPLAVFFAFQRQFVSGVMAGAVK